MQFQAHVCVQVLLQKPQHSTSRAAVVASAAIGLGAQGGRGPAVGVFEQPARREALPGAAVSGRSIQAAWPERACLVAGRVHGRDHVLHEGRRRGHGLHRAIQRLAGGGGMRSLRLQALDAAQAVSCGYSWGSLHEPRFRVLAGGGGMRSLRLQALDAAQATSCGYSLGSPHEPRFRVLPDTSQPVEQERWESW